VKFLTYYLKKNGGDGGNRTRVRKQAKSASPSAVRNQLSEIVTLRTESQFPITHWYF